MSAGFVILQGSLWDNPDLACLSSAGMISWWLEKVKRFGATVIIKWALGHIKTHIFPKSTKTSRKMKLTGAISQCLLTGKWKDLTFISRRGATLVARNREHFISWQNALLSVKRTAATTSSPLIHYVGHGSGLWMQISHPYVFVV